ncbi:Hypothetical predicted protein [Mytilus galloprovincialis]|uniref:Uncharacterized protein n=1 Tax=Mytilus galloprovincialis TaxID=29158 RepID=A0A8B6BGS8_MYTGA|nr:Hypothetical predicted protein [Mytilus galloprovincialis]
MADWIPLVSQVKSFVQWVCGDSDGAKQTQINFTKQCILVSQLRSLGELIFISKEAAIDTQCEFRDTTVYGVLDSIPIVGHLKGLVHYALKDRERGDRAMKAASRTAATLFGATVGFALGGPPGAVAGGVSGGILADGITTGLVSSYCWEYKPSGFIKEVTDVYNDPKNGGKWFDAVFTILGDGLTGYFMGKGAIKAKIAVELRKFECLQKVLIDEVGPEATVQSIEAATRLDKTHTIFKVPENKPHITSVVEYKDEFFDGHNEQVRKHCRSEKGKAAQTEHGNYDVMSDYSMNNETPTHFENKFPKLKVPKKKRNGKKNRKPRTCAEHRAYTKLYKKYPDANPKDTRVCTVQYAKNGKIRAIKRCDNCLAFKSGMGVAPTDFIPDLDVPKKTRYGKTRFRNQAAKGVGWISLVPLLQHPRYYKRKQLMHVYG